MRRIFNIIAFQVCWYVSVRGAAEDRFWIGPVAVSLSWLIHLILTRERASFISLTAVFAVAGIIVDTGLMIAGTYSPASRMDGAILSPYWLVFMWVNLSLIMNESLRWLLGRYGFAAGLGAFGGAISYTAGAGIGAIVIHEPGGVNLCIIAGIWGMVMPLLVWITVTVNRIHHDMGRKL